MKNDNKQKPMQVQSQFSSYLRRLRALNLAILATLYAEYSQANPNGAQIISGQVSINNATPGVTTVTNSPNAIINWQNFSIAQHEITRFIQQNSQSAVLNRIIGQNPSEILGQLASNGKVFLINPNGIVFGAGSTVDTQGLIASSLNLSNQDFLSGNYHFLAGSSTGNILNEGIIRAGKDGNILLIAPKIENNGIIKTEGGSITLAAGQELTITNLDNPDIRFQIQAPADSVLNLGKLLSEGGAINVFASTIKHSGEINADSVQIDKQGNIQLVAAQDITLDAGSKISANNSAGDAGTVHIDSKAGTTLAQGEITAQGAGSSAALTTGKGGKIELLGEQVGVVDKASIDASGQNGGGQILIGGDKQGKNPAVHNAKATYIGKDTTIKADAKTKGDGGKVVVWSENATRAYGDISAKGGNQSGDGGFIETSGHWLDTADIKINASSPNGHGGNWLLDPYNLTISGTATDTTTTAGSPYTFSSGASGASGTNVLNTAIQNQLNLGTSVTLQTTGTNGDVFGNGDLTVSSAIAKTAGAEATLTLSAHNNIAINAAITSTFGKLNVTLTPNSDALAGGAATISNTVDLNAGTLTLNGATTLSGTVKNGILTNPGGAVLTSSSGTLDGVTIGSDLTESGQLYLSNGLTLGNGVTVNKGSSNWNFNTTGLQHIASLGASTINNAGGTTTAGQATFGQTLQIDSGITLQGYGLLNSVNRASIINAGHIIANTAAQIFTINPPTFTNNGTLRATAGTLSLSNFASNAGIIDLANGATLQTNNASLTNASTGTIKGFGNINLGSTAFTLTNNGIIGSSTTPNYLNLTGNLSLNSGSILNATLAGLFKGTGYSSIRASGNITINTGATVNVSEATGFIGSTGDVFQMLEAGGILTGTFSTLNLPSASYNSINDPTGKNLLLGNNTSSSSPVLIWNSDASGNWATAGLWNLNRVPTTGDIVLIDRPNGAYTVTVSSGSQIAGRLLASENLSITGGSLSLNGAAESYINSAGSLTLSGGTLGGTGNLTVSGSFNVTGGSALVDMSTFTTQGTSLIAMAEANGFLKINNYKTWINQGTLTVGGDDYLNFGYNSGGVNTLTNTVGGILNLSSSFATPITQSQDSTLNNQGTLNQTVTGIHAITTGFHNTGTVNVNAGTLSIFSGDSDDTGIYSISTGATLNFATGIRNLNTGSNITGTGSLTVSGAILTANNLLSIASTGAALNVSNGVLNVGLGAATGMLAPVAISGGTLNFNTAITLPSLTMSGGELGGSGNIVITGPFNVTGTSILNGKGTLTTQGTSLISMGATNGFLGINGGYGSMTWINQGTLTVGGDDYLNFGYPNGGINTLTNTATGTLNLSSTFATPISIWSGTNTINNAGILNQTLTGSHAISTAFINTGSINVNAGTLNIAGAFSSNDGIIQTASGSTFQKSAGFTNTGTLSGNGTIAVGTGESKLINQGNINPGVTGGAGAGTLNISGDLQLTSTSNLNIDLGGTTAGLSDKLTVTGNMTTAGTLNASLLSGYVPTNADFMPFMTIGGTASGTFTTTSLPINFNAGYNLATGEAARLIYTSDSGTATFTNVAGGLDWATPNNWSTHSLPGASDTALISTGYAVTHTTGTDSIAALTINSGNSLNVSGGSLAVSGLTTLTGGLTVSDTGSAALNGGLNGATSGLVSISGGNLNLGGTASINSLSMNGGSLTGTGNVSVNTSFSQTGGSISKTGGDILINQMSGDLILGSIATGGSGSLTLKANNAVIVNPGASLTTQSGNIILNADADSSGAGNIQINDGSTINSHGGNIILGGGTCTTTGCTGAAVGYGVASGQKEGIYLYSNSSNWNTQLNSGGSNIYLNGQGYSGVSENYGIFSYWAQLDATGANGSGRINLTGMGGGGNAQSGTINSSMGVFIDASNLYTNNGNITVNGTGGNGLTQTTNNYGVGITGSGSIFTISGSGNIDITGHGGTGTDNNHGIWENISHFTTSSGSILFKGYANELTTGTDNKGIQMDQGDFATGGSALGSGFLTTDSTGGTTLNGINAVGSINATNAKSGNIELTNTAETLTITGISNSAGNVTLNASGTITALGAVNVAGIFTLGSGSWNQVVNPLPSFFARDFRITGGTFIRALDGDGSSETPYQLADIYGVQGMGSSGILGKSYALNLLGNNIDASGTAAWNAGAGFVPIGTLASPFTGQFNGLNMQHHSISGLTINRPTTDFVGLFGYMGTGSVISNTFMVGGSMSGHDYVGGLVGYNSGTISNSYATGSVSGDSAIGGLVGYNNDGGTVFNSYATGNVNGWNWVGGLVGLNVGGDVGSTVSDSYATGSVSGNSNIGGLVGLNDHGSTVSNSYASGSVSGDSSVGGLVGVNDGTISNSFWNTRTSAQPADGIGGGSSLTGAIGLSTAQMQTKSSFTGWHIVNIGNSGAIWRIYEGHTTPLLTRFMTTLTLADAPDVSTTYDGNAQSGATTAISGVLGAAATGTNAGFYNGYYSNQQGYDISGGNLTITAAAMNAISLNGSRDYDGTNNVAANIFTLAGLVKNETLTLTGVGTVADKNVGVNKAVTLGSLALNDGANGGLATNYTFTGGTQVANITAASLNVIANADHKTYGSLDPVLTYSATGFVPGESASVLTGALARTAGETVANGPYQITQGTLGNSNYTLSYTGADFTINPALLTLTAALTGTTTKTYDGTASATLTPSNFTLGGFVSTDSATVTKTTGTYASQNVGSGISVITTLAPADFSASGTTSLSNYTLPTDASGLIGSITAASLNVIATAEHKTYGSLDPVLTYSATGFVPGESASVLTGTLARTAGETVAGGPYQITQGTLGNSNYTLSYTGADFTINPALLTLTAALTGTTTKTYDGTASATLTPSNFTLGGFVSTDSATVTKTTGTYASQNVGSGISVITTLAPADFNASGTTSLSNYTLPTGASGLIGSITAASLNVIANAEHKTYGSPDPVLTYSATGFVPGESASVLTGALARTAGETVANGPYQITQGTLGNSNYTLSYTGADFTINPALLTLTAALTGTTTKTYDGTASATLTPSNFTLGGFVSTDSATVTKTTGTYASQNVSSNLTISTTLFPTDFSPLGTTVLSNYILPTSASGLIGSITPLASQAWIGGNGDWTTAGNWANGILPTTGNVLAVTIPPNVTVIYNAETQLNSLSSKGQFQITGGTFGVNSFDTAQYSQTGGTLTATNFTASNNFDQSNGILNASSFNVGSTSSRADFFKQSGGTLSADNITIYTTNNILQNAAGNIKITDSLTADSSGNVNLDGLNVFTVANKGILDIAAKGNIDSHTVGVYQITNLSAPNGKIDVENTGGFILGPKDSNQELTVANAEGKITITAKSPLTVNGIVSSTSGGVSLTASNGAALAVNAPISGPGGINLAGGTLSGSNANSYTQFFNIPTAPALPLTTITKDTDAAVLGITATQSGNSPIGSNTNSSGESTKSTDSTDSTLVANKKLKQCVK